MSGVETLGVQFVNTNHALIIQFDGSATSSGSMDTQTLSSALNDGNYAFTLSGVDPAYEPIVFGGVFSISAGGTALQGTFDVDDAGAATTPTLGTPFSGTITAPDAFGRGTINQRSSGDHTQLLRRWAGGDTDHRCGCGCWRFGHRLGVWTGHGHFQQRIARKLYIWRRKQLVRKSLCSGRHVCYGSGRRHIQRRRG